MKKVYVGLAIILLLLSVALALIFFTTGNFPKILGIVPTLLIIIIAAASKKE